MTDPSLSPGYARITYNGVLAPHHMTVPLNYELGPVGTPQGVEPNVIQKDGTVVSGSTAIAAFLGAIKAAFPASVSFGLVEFHTVIAANGNDFFIWSYNAGIVGTNVASRNGLVEFVMTVKAATGGLYRLYLMEPSYTEDAKQVSPFADAVALAIGTFLTSDNSPVYARSNAYLLTPVSWLTKINDSLRKQAGLG